MRRSVWLVLLVVAGSAVVAFAAVRLHHSSCKDPVERSTARAALTAYYASCGEHPHDVTAPLDGRIPGDQWDNWHSIQEFAFVQDGATWFVRVGQKTASSMWIVISEGSGP